jgi:hypothetical protein
MATVEGSSDSYAAAPAAPAEAEGRRSLLATMAAMYGMEARAFEATARDCLGMKNASREQLAALLVLAHRYGLDPVARQIFAVPNKGGFQAVVSVDGWVQLVNSHPECNGFAFEDIREGGQLVAIRCRMFRKDREHPSEACEYLAECRGDSPAWARWPARMLRHKAFVQAARYAFGFSGIVDPDEAERVRVEPPAAAEPVVVRPKFPPASGPA